MQKKVGQVEFNEQDFRPVGRSLRRPGRGIRSVIGSVLAGGLILAFAGPASAETVNPTTFADEFGTGSACSLREAVQSANTDSAFGGCDIGNGADVIQLRAGTYTLSRPSGGAANAGGDLDIESNVTISYAGIGQAVIRNNSTPSSRVVNIDVGATATITGVTIRDGELVNDMDPMTPDESGGGIQNQGTLTLVNSTVANNASGVGGGGIQSTGTATLRNVTISGNRADSNGGGIRNLGTLTLNNATVANNVADDDADGGDGGGIQAGVGHATTLNNTIVAGNTDRTGQAPDCDRATGSPAIGSGGNNLIGTTTGCDFASVPSDLGGNAQLGPLKNNGGSTLTHPLAAASKAVNAGGADSTASDQRGVPRSNPDIGAYELARCGGVIVNRVGTSAGQTLTGTGGADGILGFGGKDRLLGLGGGDGLCGGGGNDTVKGGKGNDKLFGNSGRDRLLGGKGNDRCVGGPGRDFLLSC